MCCSRAPSLVNKKAPESALIDEALEPRRGSFFINVHLPYVSYR